MPRLRFDRDFNYTLGGVGSPTIAYRAGMRLLVSQAIADAAVGAGAARVLETSATPIAEARPVAEPREATIPKKRGRRGRKNPAY